MLPLSLHLRYYACLQIYKIIKTIGVNLDTRERLRKQRKSDLKHISSVFGLGMGLGLALGFGLLKVNSISLTPNWFYFLAAYTLGGVTVLLFWHITSLRKKSSEETR